jgi:hypothetical protein
MPPTTRPLRGAAAPAAPVAVVVVAAKDAHICKSRAKLPRINELKRQLHELVTKETRQRAEYRTPDIALPLREHRRRFGIFVHKLVLTSYLAEMLTSARYSVADVRQMDMAAAWKREEQVAEIYNLLHTFYMRHNRAKAENAEELEACCARYRTHELVLLQRLYRKYVRDDYPVCEDRAVAERLCPELLLLA